MTEPLKLYFQREGDNSSLTFIILHGLFGSTSNFSTLAKALATDFDVIRFDLRNHGRSPHSNAMDYPSLAADVAATLMAEGVSAACVLGHSMGGKVAMQLAADYPALVKRLIVADIAPKAYSNNSHDEVLGGLNKLVLAAITSRKDADERLASYLSDGGLRQFLLSNLVRGEQGFRWRINLAAICENYANIAAAPSQTLPFDKPSLFIRGGSSGYIQPEDYGRIMECFPTATIKTIDGAGHWLHAERPQQFLVAVQNFLADI